MQCERWRELCRLGIARMSSSPSWLLVATVMAADDNVCWPYHKTHGSSLVRSAIQWAPTRKKLGWKNVRLVFSRFMINLTEETVLKVGCHPKSHIKPIIQLFSLHAQWWQQKKKLSLDAKMTSYYLIRVAGAFCTTTKKASKMS